MVIKQMDGNVTMYLTAKDCALLAAICDYAVDGGLFDAQEQEETGAYCSAMGCAFQATALACTATLEMTHKAKEDWRQEVARLGLIA